MFKLKTSRTNTTTTTKKKNHDIIEHFDTYTYISNNLQHNLLKNIFK